MMLRWSSTAIGRTAARIASTAGFKGKLYMEIKGRNPRISIVFAGCGGQTRTAGRNPHQPSASGSMRTVAAQENLGAASRALERLDAGGPTSGTAGDRPEPHWIGIIPTSRSYRFVGLPMRISNCMSILVSRAAHAPSCMPLCEVSAWVRW